MNINGYPYTTAGEDLDLTKLVSACKERIGQETLNALRTGEYDTRPLFEFLTLAYALGRAKGGVVGKPTGTEWARVQALGQRLVERLALDVHKALAGAKERNICIDVSWSREIIEQAYYAGREDGAG